MLSDFESSDFGDMVSGFIISSFYDSKISTTPLC